MSQLVLSRGEGRKWTENDNCSDADYQEQCFQIFAVLTTILDNLMALKVCLNLGRVEFLSAMKHGGPRGWRNVPYLVTS